jgi:hypothetical protein
MDFIFGLPPDKQLRTGILVFVDRFSKMVHLIPVKATVSAQETAQLFVDTIFRLHGMPMEIVSDRDPRFTSVFWRSVFKLVGTNLSMSTAAHPETDGQTERVNRVLEDVLRSYATTFSSWSSFLPIAEFAINHSVHSSHGHTPFFVNYGKHPSIPALLNGVESHFDVGETHDSNHVSSSPQQNQADLSTVQAFPANFDELPELSNSSKREQKSIKDFILQRQMTLQYVRDSLAAAVDRQKEQADKRGRKNTEVFKVNDLVLLATANLPTHALSNMKSRKLLDRFIGPFRVLSRHGDAYTIDVPKAMRLHPTFYVGRLKRYRRSMEKEINPLNSSDQSISDPSTSSEQRSLEADQSLPSGGLIPSGADQALPSVELTPSGDGRQPSSTSQRSQNSSEFAYPDQSSHVDSPPIGSTSQRSSLAAQQRAETSESAAAAAKNTSHSTLEDQAVTFSRNRPGPPPLVDSHGQQRWIVETIVEHRDVIPSLLKKLKDKHGQIVGSRILRNGKTRLSKRKDSVRVYRVRWIGYSPDQDTWVQRSLLEEDVPDVVHDYERTLSSQ